MRWVKHICRTSKDEFVVGLIDLFGLEGYGRYWRLIETIAEHMDAIGEPQVSLDWSEWQQILRGKRNKLETFLKHFQNESKINLECTGNVLKITYPNIKKIQDRYAKRCQESAKQVPKVCHPKNIEVEVESSALKKQEQKRAAPAKPSPAPMAFSGQKISITEKQDEGFCRAFPWVDRPAEYAKMDSWLLNNLDRHIVKFGAFAHRWLVKIPAPSRSAAVSAADSGKMPVLQAWTCANCGLKQQSEKGFLRVCAKCGAPN